MSGASRHDRGWILILLLLAAVLVLPTVREALGSDVFPGFYLVLLFQILFWTAQATSWNLLSGFGGYFSFGQGAFYGVGAYAMAVVTGRQDGSWLVAILVGGVLAMVLALVVGTIAFRLRSLRGEIFALLTLALPFILLAVARLSDAIDGGQGVIVPVPEFPSFFDTFQDFVFVVGGLVAVLAVAVSYWMSRTRYGWALFAIHDDEDVAEAIGVPTFAHKMYAIALTGLLAGLAGAVNAMQVGFVTPEGTFNLRVPVMVIVMSVLGGRRHWAGPMVGAAYVTILQNRLQGGTLEGWSLIILGLVLAALVLLAPDGLMARFKRRRWLVAGIVVAVPVILDVTGLADDRVWAFAAGLGVAAIVGFLPVRKVAAVVRSVETAGSPVDESVAPIAEGRVVAETVEVRKHFGGLKAVDGVSVRVHEGEILGLVGPNGSGKTTLVNLVSGLLPVSDGTIRVNGTQTSGLRPHKIAHLGVARTYQIPRPFPSLTVRDNVAIAIMFGREPKSLSAAREEADEFLALVGLSHRAESLPGGINLHERQLLEMARAMATRPKLLLLDEALAGLNPVEIDNAVEVVRRIHRSGVSIVLVEHLLRVVNQLATRIVVLDQGHVLAAGAPSAVMTDPKVVGAYLGRRPDAAGL
ncbi:MAG TPA: branched-chain amino acid ABC transporter ATP-binding protein/permease [Acidimicrobiia bacterium]